MTAHRLTPIAPGTEGTPGPARPVTSPVPRSRTWRFQRTTSALGVIAVAATIGALTSWSLRLAVGVVLGAGLVLAIVAVRPPVEYLLPVIPCVIPLGAAAYVSIGSARLPIIWADLASAMVLVAWLVRPTRLPARWSRLMALLFLCSTMSAAMADDRLVSLAALKVILQALLLGLIAGSTSGTNRNRALTYYAAGLVLMGVEVSALLLMGGAGLSGEALATAAAQKIGSDLGFARSNYLAALIVLSVAGSLVLWRHSSWKPCRLLVVLCLPIQVLGLIATGSKTQTLTLAVVMLIAVLVEAAQPRSKKLLSRTLTVGGIVVLALLVLPLLSSMFEPVVRAGGPAAYNTVIQRNEIWVRGLGLIAERPILGVGLQAMTLENGAYTMAHNTLLQVAVETGFVGLCLYLPVVIEPVRRQHGVLAGTAFLVFLAVIVSGFAENTLRTREYDFAVWPLFGVLLAARETMRPSRGAAT